jgi:hypothetical protein
LACRVISDARSHPERLQQALRFAGLLTKIQEKEWFAFERWLLHRSKNEHTLAPEGSSPRWPRRLHRAASRRVAMLTIKNAYAAMLFTWLALAAAVMFLVLARALSEISLTLN